MAHDLQAELTALEALVQEHQLHSEPEVMNKVGDQISEAAVLIDHWWQWVARDLSQLILTPPWRRWAKEVLLP